MSKATDKLQVELDVTAWMKEKYGNKISAEVKGIALVQDENEEKTYVRVIREYTSLMGTFKRTEMHDMDICEEADGSHPYADSKPIEVIAKELFNDEESLLNITSVFEQQ